MNKTKLILGSVAFYIALCVANVALPATISPVPASAAQTSDKDPSNDLPNPDQPYYDLWGNEFAFDGTLMRVSTCPYSDPISGKPNPYCDTYVPHTPTGCPYGDSIPLDSPKCAPPANQTTTPPATVNPNQCWGK